MIKEYPEINKGLIYKMCAYGQHIPDDEYFETNFPGETYEEPPKWIKNDPVSLPEGLERSIETGLREKLEEHKRLHPECNFTMPTWKFN
jgi:hypothetical protein